MKMLKTENGVSEGETSIGSMGKDVKKELLYDDDEAKKLIQKREEALKKKHGKDYKMSFGDILKTGAFAFKE